MIEIVLYKQKIPSQIANQPGDMELRGVNVFLSHFSHLTRADIVDLFEASKTAGLTVRLFSKPS